MATVTSPVAGPPVGQAPPEAGNRSSRTSIIFGVVGVTLGLAGLIVGAVLAFGGDSSSEDNAGPTKNPTAAESNSSGPAVRDPDPGSSPKKEELNATTGVKLPILDGWEQATPNEAGGDVIETGQHPCPDDETATCIRAAASIHRSGENTETTPLSLKDIAKADAEANAEDYFGDSVTRHKEVKTETVSAVSESGYRARWKLWDKSGPLAFVESVAFHSPHGHGEILVLRLVIEISPKAPSPALSEEILKGMKRMPRTDRGLPDVVV